MDYDYDIYYDYNEGLISLYLYDEKVEDIIVNNEFNDSYFLLNLNEHFTAYYTEDDINYSNNNSSFNGSYKAIIVFNDFVGEDIANTISQLKNTPYYIEISINR